MVRLSASETKQLQAKFGADAIVHFGGQHKFLSNFTPAPFVLDGVAYGTSEHAFQAQKTTDAAARARIGAAPTARRAKALGRKEAGGPHATPGWFTGGRDDAMRKAVAAKVRVCLWFARPCMRIAASEVFVVWQCCVLPAARGSAARAARAAACVRARCLALARSSRALAPPGASLTHARAHTRTHTQFAPGSELANKLLRTLKRPLVQGNTWGDAYWCARPAGLRARLNRGCRVCACVHCMSLSNHTENKEQS
jgi:hypothetical protein